jgi:hypothetical protein
MLTSERAGDAAAPEPKRLTDEERLRIENCLLRCENLKLQQERLRSDLIRSASLLQDVQNEIRGLQRQLSEKYGVDIATVQILADGTLVPPAPPCAPQPASAET